MFDFVCLGIVIGLGVVFVYGDVCIGEVVIIIVSGIVDEVNI